jgi:hypothetical protein
VRVDVPSEGGERAKAAYAENTVGDWRGRRRMRLLICVLKRIQSQK